jgi:hypothetical protein
MSRLRRATQRVLEIFDYRTFAVAGAFLTLLLVGFLVVSSIQAARDATDAQNRARVAASRRIDLLNTEITRLQGEIAAGRDQRGQLALAVAALSAQVRDLGGQPIVTVTTVNRSNPQPAPAPTASRSAAPRATSSPRPRPSRTPAPSPTPTCRALPVIGCVPIAR